MIKNITIQLLLFVTLLLQVFQSQAQVIQIGTGTTSASYAPITSCYRYSYSQQIYLASEILTANGNSVPSGSLTKLRFFINSTASSSANSNQWRVLIGQSTTKSVFNGTTAADWLQINELTEVFNGTVTLTGAGTWMEIPLTTPIVWNGVGNLIVAVWRQASSYDCSWYFNYTSTSSNYRTMWYYNDNTTIPLVNPMGVAATTRSYNRPNIQFVFEAPCSPTTVFPTANVGATKDTICLGKSATLSIAPNGTMPSVTGLTYQLQESANATGPWTNVGAAFTNLATTHSVSPTTSTYYRYIALCNNSATSFVTATKRIVVENYSPITGTALPRCGPGDVTFTSSSTTALWYENLTASIPFGTGTTAQRYFTANGTVYIADGRSSGFETATIGAGVNTSSTSAATPFYGSWGGYKHEYLVTEAELAASGILPGTVIHSWGIQLRTSTTTPYQGFQVSIGTTTNTTVNTTFIPGLTVVRPAANYVGFVGVNMFDFNAPYVYPGGNLVIQTCWSNATSSNPNSYVVDDNVPYTCTHYYYRDNETPAQVCGYTSGGTTTTLRPKFFFKIVNTCESARTPVTVTLTPPPAISATTTPIICNNSASPITVSSTLSNYDQYTWRVLTGNTNSLYTDAAGTIPYVANTNTNTIYYKNATPGNYLVELKGVNTVTGCSNFDTVEIQVLPSTIKVEADKGAFCASGSTTLNVLDQHLLPNVTVQWQQSDNNSTFTNIAGATGFSYTTNTSTTTKYYRAVLTGFSTSCFSSIISDTVYIEDPSNLMTLQNGFNCGTGSQTLVANVPPGYQVNWYSSLTSTTPLHTGDTFITPVISNTTTYYATNSSPVQNLNVKLGTGTSTISSAPNPYYTFYYGVKHQYLVLASELQALGLSAGFINSLGFEVVANAGLAMTNFTIKMGHTTATTMTTAWQTVPMTTVFTTPSYMPIANSDNIHIFQTPFEWDGVSNVVIETCYNNTSYASGHTVKYTTGYSFNTSLYLQQDNATVCSNTTSGYNLTSRPNMLFNFSKGCEGNKKEVLAVVQEKNYAGTIPANDFSYCPNSTGLLKAANSGLIYQWYKNGQIIPNATADSLIINDTGSYHMVVIKNGCPDTSNVIKVRWYNLPVVNLGSDFNICEGTVATLNANAPGNSILWDNNTTNQTRVVNAAGTYYVRVTSPNNCVVIDTINIGTFPRAVPNLGSDINICRGDVVTLDPGNFATYTWSDNSTNPTLSINDTGTYYVKVTNDFGCIGYDTVKLTLKPTSSIQGFSFIPYFYDEAGKVQFNVINPRNVTFYNWDFGDSTFSNIMNPIHKYQMNGTYTVKLTVGNNLCPESTNIQDITVDFRTWTGIEDLEETSAKVYPNPAKDKLNIELSDLGYQIQSIEIYDAIGRLVKVIEGNKKHLIQINTEDMISGTYNIFMSTNNGNFKAKFKIVK